MPNHEYEFLSHDDGSVYDYVLCEECYGKEQRGDIDITHEVQDDDHALPDEWIEVTGWIPYSQKPCEVCGKAPEPKPEDAPPAVVQL